MKAKTLFYLFIATADLAAATPMNEYYPLQAAIKRFENGEDPTTRIIGGSNAAIADNPWQMALLHAADSNRQRAQFCGASVISADSVVTAAHCVDGGAKKSQIIVLGHTRTLSSGGYLYSIERIIIHRRWNRVTGDADIAILKLIVPINNPLPTPIQLNSITQLDDGAKVRVTGWGITSNRAFGTDILQAAEIDFVPVSTCTRPQNYGNRITYNMLCAGEKKKSICSGDSGGPATVLIESRRSLAGITSWSDGCGLINKVNVFTKIANFRNWILENS